MQDLPAANHFPAPGSFPNIGIARILTSLFFVTKVMFSKRVTTDRTGRLCATGKVFQKRRRRVAGRHPECKRMAPGRRAGASIRKGRPCSASGDDTTVSCRRYASKRSAASASNGRYAGGGTACVARDKRAAHIAFCTETAARPHCRLEMPILESSSQNLPGSKCRQRRFVEIRRTVCAFAAPRTALPIALPVFSEPGEETK